MPRLFSALYPADAAVQHLVDRLDAVASMAPDLRWEPVGRWHVTLCFYGEEDIEARRDWLRTGLADHPAPRLRLTGAEVFPDVLWIGVDADTSADAAALTGLAEAAGADPGDYRPHLTLARWRSRHSRARGRVPGAVRTICGLLGDYTGPWFTPTEARLMRSEQGQRGSVYHVVERLALVSR